MKLLAYVVLVIFLLQVVAFAQEPPIGTNPPPTNTSDQTTGGGPFMGCVKAQWNSDEYCLYNSYDENKASDILDAVKSKMIKTISENYFKEHFDLHEVSIDSGEVDFSYRVGDYKDVSYGDYRGYLLYDDYRDLSYVARIKTEDGVRTIELIPPREVVQAINRNLLFSESRKCIGTTDLKYDITSGFRIIASGDEPYAGNHNHFDMDLESGKVACYLVSAVATVEGSAGNGFPAPRTNVPCYDCWKDYMPYAAIIILIIIGLVAWKIKRA